MDLQALESSARNILSSSIVGAGWLPHLEAMMVAMEAKGGGPARLAYPSFFALPTSGLQETYAKFRTGDAPPLTRLATVVVKPEEGFVADYMRLETDVRIRDPFYQEFLRPHDCLHQAAAFLDTSDDGELKFQLFRDRRQGPFEASELEGFTRILPYLRSAAMVSRGVSLGMARDIAMPFERRGEPSFGLDERGRAFALGPAAEKLSETLPIHIVARRLVGDHDHVTRRLDRAVKEAIRFGGRPCSVVLNSTTGARHQLLVCPLHGEALDVFCSTRAIATLVQIGGDLLHETHRHAEILLSTGFDLTPREAELAVLVAGGLSPAHIAKRLAFGEGTVRNHIKSVFRKTELHSQTELAALVGRYH